MSATTPEEMFHVVRHEYRALHGDEWAKFMKENGTLLWMSDQLIPWEDLPEIQELFDGT